MRPSKRDELVQKALYTFYRNGFGATSMDMLVQESGISKTSMYNHFRTKDELILAVLRLRDEKFRNWLFRRMAELGSTPREQMIAMFDALADWFEDPEFKGCMFIKACSEFQDRQHPIHKHCADHKRMIQDYLIGLATAAGLSKPVELVQKLILLKEGAIVAAQLGNLDCPAKSAKEAAAELIKLADQR